MVLDGPHVRALHASPTGLEVGLVGQKVTTVRDHRVPRTPWSTASHVRYSSLLLLRARESCATSPNARALRSTAPALEDVAGEHEAEDGLSVHQLPRGYELVDLGEGHFHHLQPALLFTVLLRAGKTGGL